MISRLNDRLILLIVVIALAGLNIYSLLNCRKIANRGIKYKEEYHQAQILKESYETGIFTHIIATKGIELGVDLISCKEPKLVLAYNDKSCTPCFANELENLKEIYKTDQFKHVIILAQIRDKSAFIALLKAHKIDSIEVFFVPDESQFSVPVKNTSGFLVYFLYQPEKKPEMIYYPLTALPDLTFKYFEMINSILYQ